MFFYVFNVFFPTVLASGWAENQCEFNNKSGHTSQAPTTLFLSEDAILYSIQKQTLQISDITHLKFDENDSFCYFCRKHLIIYDTD